MAEQNENEKKRNLILYYHYVKKVQDIQLNVFTDHVSDKANK